MHMFPVRLCVLGLPVDYLPHSIGDRSQTPAAESSGNGSGVAQKVKRRPVFSVSGMHSDDRRETATLLKSLGLSAPVELSSHRCHSALPAWNLRQHHNGIHSKATLIKH